MIFFPFLFACASLNYRVRESDIIKAHGGVLDNHKDKRRDDKYKRLGKMTTSTVQVGKQVKREIITLLELLFFVSTVASLKVTAVEE